MRISLSYQLTNNSYNMTIQEFRQKLIDTGYNGHNFLGNSQRQLFFSPSSDSVTALRLRGFYFRSVFPYEGAEAPNGYILTMNARNLAALENLTPNH